MVKNDMTLFPGMDSIKSELVYRSSRAGQSERLGAGFLNKSGKSADFVNYRHSCFVIVIVLRGSGFYIDDAGTKFPLNSGMMFKRLPDKLHSTYVNPESGWVECFLEIGRTLYQSLRSWLVINPDIPVESINLDNEFIDTLWQFKEQLSLADETRLPLLVGDIFKLMVECQRRCDATTTSGVEIGLIDDACSFLGTNFNSECDLKKFCRRNGVGYENFRKIFRQKTGISPWQYRIKRKLDFACALLRDPALSVNKISNELGYTSPYEFSAQFKKHIGISPAHYRSGSSK